MEFMAVIIADPAPITMTAFFMETGDHGLVEPEEAALILDFDALHRLEIEGVRRHRFAAPFDPHAKIGRPSPIGHGNVMGRLVLPSRMDRTAGLQGKACQKYGRKVRLHRLNGPRKCAAASFPQVRQ